MAETFDLSGNGGRSNPTYTNDRSGRPEAPLVVDGSSTAGNSTEQTIAGNQLNGNQKTQVVGSNGVVSTVRPLSQAITTSDSGIVVQSATQNYDPVGNTFVGTLGGPAGTYVINKGGSNIATGQVAVSTSATLVAAARAYRQKITLSPTSSVVYYVGGSAVSTTTGLYVAAGGSITLDTNAAIYAVGASAFTVSFIEFY